MNTERTEKFVNAIGCDLEEGGFRQVSGTTLRRTLATAVSAALPLLGDIRIPASQPAELAEQQGVELPPLPASRGFIQWHSPQAVNQAHGFTSTQMQDYARAALAATGKQQGGEVQGDALGWSGWATQKPGHMPKLWGTREIAELNHDLTGDARLIFLSEQPAQGVDRWLTEEEREWIDYAIAHMRDDSEPEDLTCADALDRLLRRADGQRDAAPGVGNG